MAMAWVWTAAVVFSVVYGAISGNIEAVGAAALEGAGAAVTLCISICGVTCLWSGVMEVIRQSGLTDALARTVSPLLRRLFPENANNKEAMAAVAANMSANMLGLGNAATPLGIKAATLMTRGGSASNDLCMLVVINTASIQLIPATVGAVRASAGAASPFDILPAVWLTSVVSVAVGITAAKILGRLWK
jgi:spore maturation protein A